MKKAIFLALGILISGCSNPTLQDVYKQWINREVKIPSSIRFFNNTDDEIKFDNSAKLKILMYADSVGCMNCRIKPQVWQALQDELDSVTNGSVPSYLVLATRYTAIKDDYRRDNRTFRVCVDISDSLNILNGFAPDDRFRTFLLDSANRVILIGNPVQFPKIKELYIRTICERLGIERTAASSDSQQPTESHDFGNFPFSETKETEFALRNESETQMKIDTVFTSCDCTTAAIDRMQIEPGGAAIVKVRFKTDHPEQFMREIYVQYGGQTRVFSIRGEAI